MVYERVNEFLWYNFDENLIALMKVVQKKRKE